MDRKQVEVVLNAIKTSVDKQVVIKCLIKLRTDLFKNAEGIKVFREAGGIAPMVRLLSKPNEKILELVLSILTNCCTDESCCNEAFDKKIVTSLTTILISIYTPGIQYRACRLLGNLGKVNATLLLSTHGPAIVECICRIIETTSDVQTRTMAFRACRILMPDAQFSERFVQAKGLYQLLYIFADVMKNDDNNKPAVANEITDKHSNNVGSKMNQHREKYFEEVERNLEGIQSDKFDREISKNSVHESKPYAIPNEALAIELVNEILKCLLVISAIPVDYKIWQSLFYEKISLAPIVHFVTTDNILRSLVLKILLNLAKTPGAFDMLNNADAIGALCELLTSANIGLQLNKYEVKYCIHLIYWLSIDACNRSKIRWSGTLHKLMQILRESDSQSERGLIFCILYNFHYDEMSMVLLLHEGLIGLLIREINNYLTSDDEYYKRKREERLKQSNKRKQLEICNEIVPKLPKTGRALTLDIDSPSSSPHSSPCSIRSISPTVKCLGKDEETDDNNYSPACSDDEDASDDDGTHTSTQVSDKADFDIWKLLDSAAETIDDQMSDKEDDDISQDVPQLKLPSTTTKSTIDVIEYLIMSISIMIDKRGELGKPETLDTLITAINLFGGNNNYATTLTNVLLESKFFAQIIKHGVVHRLYQLTKLEHMRNDGFGFLETLTNVGESNYGKEELVRLLRSSDVVGQGRAAITVAHIIKNRRLLYQFLHDGNALAIMFELVLKSKIDQYSVEAADALTSMSCYTFGITLPKSESTYMEMNIDEDDAPHRNCDIRFVVINKDADDSGKVTSTVIGFNKQLLCNISEVFNVMLNSDFREGNEGEIQLQQYSAHGLKYFLNLVVRETLKQTYNIPPKRNYSAILEAFEMSRIYIIPTMEANLQKLLMQLLDADNCLNLLEWSLENYHVELTYVAINYYLCAQLSTERKVALFREANYSKFSTQWNQLINDAVYDRCVTGS